MTYNKFLNLKNAWLENKIDACIDLSYCYNQVKCEDMYLPALFKSFELDTPRAKVCCLIGIYFMQNENYKLALYYFKLALKDKPNYKSGAFIEEDYYKFIPYINLCYCYAKIGKYNIAKQYNKKAESIHRDNKYVKINNEYLNNY